MATIQIPVLFDMSGDTIVFGEELSGDFIYSHLNFVLDMTTEANDISLNAADISGSVLVGDNDYTDNIFYSGGSSDNIAVDNLCNRISKAITRGKLVHIPQSGNSSNSGIPMGGRAQLVNNVGTTTGNGAFDKYAIKYLTSISPIGDEQMLGEAMARVASIHLVGSPLSAGIFENKNSVQLDLETTSGQTFNSGNTSFYNALAVQLSKVLGGSKSSAPMNSGFVVDATPKTTVEYTRIHVLSPNNPNTITIIDEDNLTGQVLVDKLLNATLGYSVSWHSYDYFMQNTGVLMDDVDQNSGNVPVTTLGDSTTIRGPWFRVDLGAQLVVSKFALGGVELYNHHLSVKEGTLLGSNDDSTWALVHTYSATSSEYFTGGTPTPTAADLKLNEKTLSSPTTYRYWRFVITSLLGSSSNLISPTANYVYVSQFVLYDNNSNDITTLSEAGVTNPYTPILTASEDYGNNATVGKKLQDNNFTTYWQVQSPGPFTTNSAGVTSISRGSTDLVGGGTLAGPWIGYDLGAATTCGKVGIALYDLIPDTAHPNMNKAPKDITILGSSDDANWNVVETITNIPILNFLGGAWVGAAITLNEIEFTEATYRYWRVSFQATHAPPSTSDGNQLLRLSDVTFFKTYPAQSIQGPLDASGVSVPALKSIYEQLMNVPGRSQIMETREVTNVPMPSGTNIPGGFPFIAGDKLVMYLRPKINFAAQTLPEQHTTLVGMPEEVGFSVPLYDVGRKNSDGGALTGQTYTQSSMYNFNAGVGFNQCFEGTAPDTSSYWLTAGDNNNSTDYKYSTNGGAYVGVSYTRFVGESKDITVATAKLQNTNEVIDTAANSFGINEGFVYYYDLQVGDTITYEHPVSGTTTTTVASVVLDNNSKPFKITLTDAHDATATNISLTFNKKENLMGEWGQVDIGQDTAVKQIDLWPYPPDQASDIPKNFHLLGSADGTNWDILKKVENEDWGLANAGGIKEYTLTPAGPYRYYRISVQLLVNNTSNKNFSLAQMVIWGAKHPTEFYRHALPLDISGLVTNFTATPENITSAFPGKSAGGPDSEELKWGWMGSTTNNVLTHDTTDITDTNTIDLHVWKITITL